MKICATLRRIILLPLFLTMFPFVLFSDSKTFEKVALIIGNNTYQGEKFNKLETCINDADEMDRCLKKLGYETVVLKDGTRQDIIDKVAEFESKIGGNTKIGIFYYSGHGFNMNGVQYLVPAKTKIPISTSSLRNRCFDMSEIRSMLKKKCEYSFLFIDACRNVETDDNKGSGWAPSPASTDKSQHQQMICYASRNNMPAHTLSSGRLSPFTKVLTSHLFDKESFQYIWANKIVPEVIDLTNEEPDRAEATDYSSFYFNPGGRIESIYETTDSDDAEKRVTITTKPISKIKFGEKYYDSGVTLIFKIGSKHVYSIEHEGYEPYTGVIQINDDTPSVLEINLKKAQEASFTVICTNPKKARVYLDGDYQGVTPVTIVTTSGMHDIRINADNYYSSETRINLKSGANDIYYESLIKQVPEFFDFYRDNSFIHQVNYHFSPKYQIGLSYMYGFDDSRFSVGAIVASSVGFYKDLNLMDTTTISSEVSISLNNLIITITDGSGETISATRETETIKPHTYSSEIDPNNEAKHFDANFMALANCGFDACNGIMLEAGVGAAYHQKRHYMSNAYNIEKTTITNNLTGELVEEPTLKYTKSGVDKWYRDTAQWSLAIRFGTRFYIPLKGDFDDSCFSIGGGYTYLPMNNQFSSWDVSIGFTWVLW